MSIVIQRARWLAGEGHVRYPGSGEDDGDVALEMWLAASLPIAESAPPPPPDPKASEALAALVELARALKVLGDQAA